MEATPPTLDWKTLKGCPLSQRVQLLREQRGVTLSRLSELTALPLSWLAEVEGGVERVLSTPQRLRLARGLRCPADWLVANVTGIKGDPTLPRVNKRGELISHGKRLPLRAMTQHPEGFWPCPACGAGLSVRTFERRDLEDNPVTHVAVACSQCLFGATHDWLDW